MKNKEVIGPVFKACVDLMDCPEYFIVKYIETFLKGIEGPLLAELDKEHVMVDTIIKRYLSGEDYSLISKFYLMLFEYKTYYLNWSKSPSFFERMTLLVANHSSRLNPTSGRYRVNVVVTVVAVMCYWVLSLTVCSNIGK